MEARRMKTSAWLARILPLAIIALFAYATWAFVTQVILFPFLDSQPRRDGSAAGLLMAYFILLILVLVCYIRLLVTCVVNPGFVPSAFGSRKAHALATTNAGHERDLEMSKPTSRSKSGHKSHRSRHSRHNRPPRSEGSHNRSSGQSSDQRPNNIDLENLSYLANREVFVCNHDGRLPWCYECSNWKPERAHHCSDTGRCVLKMDHFCPWAGGMVSATTFKFFIQFTAYCAIYCIFTIVSSAVVFVTQLPSINPHFIALFVIGGFFGLFTGVLACQAIGFAFTNSTSVEWLDRNYKIYTIAVQLQEGSSDRTEGLPIVTYPIIPSGSIPARQFALITLSAGMNPFDMGWKRNMQDVFGFRPIDWLLPIHYSPCLDEPDVWSEHPHRSALFKALQLGGQT